MAASIAVLVDDAGDGSSTGIAYDSIGGGCPRCSGWPEELIRARTAAHYWQAQHRRAVEREEKLKKQIETLEAKLRQRERELFGRKAEGRRKKNSERLQKGEDDKKRKRGQQPGGPKHGRGRHDNLPAEPEEHDLAENQKCCPCCGLPYEPFEGTEDSEVIEIEVRAHRRVIKRKRYKSICKCPGVPGIVTAPSPPKLIPKGSLGVSVWVMVLLDKFLWQRPTYRLLTELRKSYELHIPQGTVTDGLKRLKPLFEPLFEAMVARNVSETRWHADETRWLVFAEVEGKQGNKWYLWVFVSKSTVVFKLDPSRSAEVPKTHFGKEATGILNVDRYVAYKVLLKYGRILLAFCWAHVRRDFLAVAKDWNGAHEAWGLEWVEKIAELYRLNKQRLAVLDKPDAFDAAQTKLRDAVEKMAAERDAQLADPSLHSVCRKVLESLKNHWSGLVLFVEHPEVPMDNNRAEREQRNPVVGRKNYYGSGAVWSGHLAAILFSLFQTLLLWNFNPRVWLTAYLNACAENGGKAPDDAAQWLPWNLSEEQRHRFQVRSPSSDDTS